MSFSPRSSLDGLVRSWRADSPFGTRRRRFATISGAVLLLGFAIAGAVPSPSEGSGVDQLDPRTHRALPSTTTTDTTDTTTASEPEATPRFEASISSLDGSTRERVVGTSWREGCPVPIDQLRYLRVTHWTHSAGTTGIATSGELIVHERVADEVVEVFRTLFDARFPIHSMRLVDDFGGQDLASMQANNTSAFNCRTVAGTSSLSWHAYGLAIDINPLVNPYVTSSGVSPPEGAPYVDRDSTIPGLITPNDVVTTAFHRAGWSWGGTWRSPDYQHFARPDAAG